ncbi:MAG: hypothetical protein Q9M22_00380 [Mariprofundaceae bacterium]|nr:hypothetical protein [Mariprofundaceae bacterium]
MKKSWSMIGCMLLLGFSTSSAMAEDSDWTIKADLQGEYGSYNKSIKRDSITNAGIIIAADYLDQGGFSLAVNSTTVKYKLAPTINQQSYFASVRYNLHVDGLPGKLMLRLDGHYISNNDVTGNSDGVKIIAPQLAFMNYAKNFYMDIGFAHSSYKNNLTINQYTPTLGFGFNDLADWAQLRAYLIDTSNPLRAQNKSKTAGAELKWTHWFAPSNSLHLYKLQAGILAGERIFAVDGDAAAVYNLADVQRGSASLGLTWNLTDTTHLMVLAGEERYLDNTIANSYSSRFVYIDLSTQW